MVSSKDERKRKAADVIENILEVLMDGENRSIEELAEKVKLSKSKTEEILGHLEDMKFVEARKDRQIKITKTGKDFGKI